MQIIEDYNDINKNIKRGIALGNFDGIHIGHQKLIKSLIDICKTRKFAPCVYTFANHTIPVVSSKESIKYITNINVKKSIFNNMGLSQLILDRFNNDLMSHSPEQFVKNILIEKLNCKIAVVGFDYRFGNKAEGDIELLKKLGEKYGFEVLVINPVKIDNKTVSSSYIRRYLKEGNIKRANKFLGRNFSLYNTVIHGDSRGGDLLGYPTVNIYIDNLQLLPKLGVYASFVKIDNKLYMGATSVGTKPTFEGMEPSVETFILDFSGNLYDKEIEIIFVDFIREEFKFDNHELLIEQIKKDVKKTKKTLQNYYNMLI